MSLSENQIKELIQTRPRKNELERAEKHQNRLRLHSETELENPRVNSAYVDLLRWVQSYLTKDKFKRFEQLIKTPFVSLEITQEIFTELFRIFDGQNPFFSYEFKNSELGKDFVDYLKNNIQDLDFFKTIGFEQLMYGINSVLVVDLPSEQTSERPEPFYYFVETCYIIDVDTNHKGDIQHIIFKKGKDKIAVYDDEFYRVYSVKNDVMTLVLESAHGLGYCPASFFWDENMHKGNRIEKKSPLTDVLGRLDKYLTIDTFKEYADLYGTFPIITAYEELCTFKDCDNGFVSRTTYEVLNGETIEHSEQVKCPVCSEREELGPGTLFEIPAPQTSDDVDLSSPVNIITPDTSSLEYIKTKLSEYANIIKTTVIGTSTKLINDQAINELQTLGSFESRRNVLINIKESFEKIHKFANDTVARLRYSDQFISSVIYYGDEFYLKSVGVLMDEYKNAKESGEPDEEIDLIYRQLIMTKYKGNNDRVERSWILLNLNPEPHKSVDECAKLVEMGAMSKTDFIIKSRFNNFILKFEREQANILEFGRDLDFDQKINLINNQLISYATEENQI